MTSCWFVQRLVWLYAAPFCARFLSCHRGGELNGSQTDVCGLRKCRIVAVFCSRYPSRLSASGQTVLGIVSARVQVIQRRANRLGVVQSHRQPLVLFLIESELLVCIGLETLPRSL